MFLIAYYNYVEVLYYYFQLNQAGYWREVCHPKNRGVYVRAGFDGTEPGLIVL